MMQGYYSKFSDTRSGHAVYSTGDGLTVKVTEVVKDGQKPGSCFNDLIWVGPVINCIHSNFRLNLSIAELGEKLRYRMAEVDKCSKQVKTTNKCFCYACPIDRSN